MSNRPRPSVAVQKRMDRLELDMRQRCFDQDRRPDRIVVQELLQRTEAIQKLICRRGDEDRIPGAVASNPCHYPHLFDACFSSSDL